MSVSIPTICDLIEELQKMDNPHTDNLHSAYLALLLYQENYPEEHELTQEQTAKLADFMAQIPASSEAEPSFSSYDYIDALIYTSYGIDPAKLIELGEKHFDLLAEIMNELAAEKRAVYEGKWHDDKNLVRIIEKYGVGAASVPAH